MILKKGILIRALVGGLLFAAVWMFFSHEEESSNTRDHEGLAPSSPKFEYQQVVVSGEAVECKYLSFNQGVNVNRITGFALKGDLGAYPQWVRYVQYGALRDPSGTREFDSGMYHPDYPERIAYYRGNWEKITESRARYAAKILSHSGDSGVTMNGTLSGLLFIRIKGAEYVVMRVLYKTATTEVYSGGYAVLNNENLIRMDEGIFHPSIDLLTTCVGSFEEILAKLKASDHGVYRVKKDPLKWSFAGMPE